MDGAKKIYMMDLDGTLCDDVRNEEGIERMAVAKPIRDMVELVNRLYNDGNFICIFTARTDEHREVTENWLRNNGVKFHQLLLNKPRRIGRYAEYHYIDNVKVNATTFTGEILLIE